MKEIAIYGAGGFGRGVKCVIDEINAIEKRWNFIGYFDDGIAKGTVIDDGFTILGNRDTLNQWNKPIDVVISIGNPDIISMLSYTLTNKNINFPNIISPNAVLWNKCNFVIGRGNIICDMCFISTNTRLGDFNILNLGVMIGHDSVLGSFNTLMPSVNISGGVRIGNKNIFGVKSSVLQYLKIGNSTKIGAHSLIMRNTKDSKLYFGVPAKIVEI